MKKNFIEKYLLKRAPKKKTRRSLIRFCIPFNIKCEICHKFFNKGLRLNAYKEKHEKTYKGVEIYIFTFKCFKCLTKISLKTNPKESRYEIKKNCLQIRIFTKEFSENSETESSFSVSNFK